MTWKLHIGDEVYDFEDPTAADISADELRNADIGVDIWVEEPRELKEAEAAKADAESLAFEAWLLEQDKKEDVK